jgi:hypothetical protein
MLSTELRKETPAPKTSQFAQEVAHEFQKLKNQGLFVCKKSVEQNIIGIIVKSRAVFEKVCQSPRVVGCYTASGDLSKSTDGSQVFSIPDLDVIMNNCGINWDRDYIQESPEGEPINRGRMRTYFKSKIPVALDDNRDHGEIPEKWFEGKLPIDSMDGVDYERNSSPLDFSTRRAMILNDDSTKALLNEKIEKNKTRTAEKKRRLVNQYKAYFENNDLCESTIRKKRKLADGEHIENVGMEIFEKIKKDLLIAFVKVRDNEDITASIEHLPDKKVGLIKAAFDVQSNPIVAKASTIPHFDDNEPTTEEQRPPVFTVNMSSNVSWSVSSDYVRRSCVLFATLSNREANFAEDAATNVDKLRDETLSEVLCARLGTRHKEYGISPLHFTARFVRINMTRAVMILKLHKLYKDKQRLANANQSESLFVPDMDLGDPFVNGEVNSTNSPFQNIGAYLMKDSGNGFMIRAGSTTTSFAKRLGEHFACSRLKKDADRKSKLYSSYPHEEASEKDKDSSICNPIGRWDDIQSFVGIGWDKKNSKEIKDLFEWDNTTISGLENNRNRMTLEKKQERMMVYLFELLLSLSLDQTRNISSNPGFEMFNGTFAKNLN